MLPYHTFYFLVVALALWCVVLRVAKMVHRQPRVPRLSFVLCGLLGITAALLPIGEFSLWRWLYSAQSNPSIPFGCMLLLCLASAATGRPWFTRADWVVLWALGAGLGTLLYLPVLGLAHYDLYTMDWEGRWIAAGATTMAVTLLALGNRAGLIILASLLGHVLDLLESDNLWDYLVDPVFWLISLGGVVNAAWRWRGATRGPATPPTPRDPLRTDQPTLTGTR